MSTKAKKKKGKGKSKLKSRSTTTKDDTSTASELKNPNFYFGSDTFYLPNGDIYIGDYCAHKIGIVWREGNGIYITKDNHSYEGIWENDQLLNSEETVIKYSDGTEYRGSVKKGKYSGVGCYILRNKIPICSTFEQNTPIGEAILTDPRTNLWIGIASEETILLLPQNHFYISLSYEKGIGEKIPEKSVVKTNSESSLKISDQNLQDMEKLIFKKSSKTKNDFVETLTDDTLTEIWSVPEKIKPEPKSSLLKAKSSTLTLLKTFLSKKHMELCKPVSVFYPTSDIK